jgi:hypothetical protein
MSKVKWYEIDKDQWAKLPEWARTYGINERGLVFIPAAVGGDEWKVYLCTTFDSTPAAVLNEHYYVPAIWLHSKFPESKEICTILILTGQNNLLQEKE